MALPLARAQDLSDPPDGISWSDSTGPSGSASAFSALGSTDPDAPTCDTGYTQGATPDVRAVGYKQFTNQAGGQTWINLDLYKPPNTFTSPPALILVHGGGFIGGCRQNFAVDARQYASQGFMVFSVDYRLACATSMAPTCISSTAALGGWNYTTLSLDPPYQPGVAMQDLRDAAKWVRDNAASYCSCWDHKIAALGSSAGATLVLGAYGPLSSTDSHRVQVLGSLSAPTELGLVADGSNYTCELTYPSTQTTKDTCWSAVMSYAGCDIRGPDPGGTCHATYDAASPLTHYASTGPPAFVANSQYEYITWNDASDLLARLVNLNVSRSSCEIEYGHQHATGYLHNYGCNVTTPPPVDPDVFKNTVDWFKLYA